jgi:hypothetical protein
MGRKPIPKPSFLDDCEYLGFVHGERRWRGRMGNVCILGTPCMAKLRRLTPVVDIWVI